MKTGRKRGPTVPTQVEALIATIYRKNRKLKAPEVQKRVSFLIHKSNPSYPPGWPGLSKVQKVLAKLRKPEPSDPQDEPWSLGTLDQDPLVSIPPDTIPSIISVWKYWWESEWRELKALPRFIFKLLRQGIIEIEDISPSPPSGKRQLSIREVKWVARLSHTISDTRRLAHLALIYSSWERVCQDIGRPFDSTALDEQFLIENKDDADLDFLWTLPE